MFNKQELSIILQLVEKAPINGRDSMIVSGLIQKIEKLIREPIKTPDSPKEKE